MTLRPALFVPLLLVARTAVGQQRVPNHPVTTAYQREELIREQNAFVQDQRRASEASLSFNQRMNDSIQMAQRAGVRTGARSASGSLERARMLQAVHRAEELDRTILAVTSRGIRQVHLEPASTTAIVLNRTTPLLLTFVSPDAGAKEPMRTRMTFSNGTGAEIAAVDGGLITDGEGMVRIELPAVPPGEYLLLIVTTSLGREPATTHTAEQRVVVPAS